MTPGGDPTCLRVVQWATGNIGARALRGVIEHPDLELVGVVVHSADKAGRDAGELCGLGPTGVLSTTSAEEAFSSGADCVLYMPQGCDFEALAQVLGNGTNVVTTRGEFHHPPSMDPGRRAQIESACERGSTSIHSTGSSPGFITEAVPLVLTSMQRRLDSLVIDEFADLSKRPSPELLFGLMGYGSSPSAFDQGRWAHGVHSFGPSLRLVAEALGLPLDAVEGSGSVAVARRTTTIAAGTIEAGTVAAQRMRVAGLRDGEPLFAFCATWYCTEDIEPAWDLRPSGWRVRVAGDVPLDVEVRLDVPLERMGAMSPGFTANRAVNAVPVVCAATPGIRTTVELPNIVANLGVAAPVRPLPEVTPVTAWFWTSGSDGRLRMQGCSDCGRLVHPPAPVCPYCSSRSWTATIVSGRATVAGFTVNHHRWHPDLDPPYVVAVVALAEDPDVRLTTTLVGCQPDEVHVGQSVVVCFEEVEDVWLPLFEPSGDPDGPNPVPDPGPIALRAPLDPERFERRAVLSGVGRSALGRRLMVDPLSLTVDACLGAIADAGLKPADIDGLSTYPGPAGMGMSEGGVSALEEALRLHPTWINGGGDLPGPAGAVIAAMLAVSAGLCRHVLCFRTVWESTFAALGQRGPTGGRAAGQAAWRAPFGALSPANWIAMNANQYLHRYGATRELLGWIALNGRANAARNPAAIYRDPMTMDDYLSARPITSPFGLYDCDVPCDGSIAVVVSAASVASDLPKPAVGVEAVGTQIAERVSWDQGTLTHEPQVLGQAAHLWTRTDLSPADVDVALVYDGFTFNAVSWLEALGFCGLGEAKDWIDGGRRIALDGELPVNPHGGQLSEGRTHGFGFLYEAVTQLRHEAGERQVDGATVAVVTSGGGTPSGVLLLRRI